MKNFKSILLSLMLMLTSGVAWSDPTFFNLFGITTETKLSEAKVLLKKHCNWGNQLRYETNDWIPVSDTKYRYREGVLHNENCGIHPEFGLKTNYVSFHYQRKWVHKFIRGLSIEIPLIPEDGYISSFSITRALNPEEIQIVIPKFRLIRDTLDNNPFYRRSTNRKGSSCFGNYEALFQYLLCSATYEHINDPKKHIDLTFYIGNAKVVLDYYAYK